MKKVTLILAAFLLCIQAFAQDSKAKSILDDFNKAIKSYPSIDIRFAFITEDGASHKSDSQDGRVLVKGSAFKVILNEMEVYSDGKTKWTVMHNVDEVNIQEVDPDSYDLLDNPISFFTVGNKGFKYSYKGSVIVAGKAMEKLEFEPKDKRSAYSAIELQIEKATKYPYQISYIGKEGESYTVRVKTFIPNAKIEDVQLQFNKSSYSSYETIDLR